MCWRGTRWFDFWQLVMGHKATTGFDLIVALQKVLKCCRCRRRVYKQLLLLCIKYHEGSKRSQCSRHLFDVMLVKCIAFDQETDFFARLLALIWV